MGDTLGGIVLAVHNDADAIVGGHAGLDALAAQIRAEHEGVVAGMRATHTHRVGVA